MRWYYTRVIPGTIWFLFWLSYSVQSAELQQEAKSQETLFLREEAVLSEKGDFSSELGVFFRRQTGTRSGSLVKRETSFVSATLRYGINRRSEISLSVPYQYVQDELSSQNVPVGGVSATGWGDAVFSFKHQLWFERGGKPDLILSVSVDDDTGEIAANGEPPLGSGHREYSIAVLAAKSLDPAIYFLHLGYRYSRDAYINGSRSEPGDTFQYRFGSGYALSDRVILSFQLVGDVVREGRFAQSRIAAEHQISFQFANTIIIGRNRFIEPLVSFGLTPESPDILFGISFPL